MKKCHYLTTLALLLALLSCQNESNKPVSSASPVKVKVMQASSSATSESRHFSGTVEESSTTSLSFPVMGTVKKIYVDLGERVTQVNPEKPDVPLNKNDAFQKVQKRRVQEKR